MAASGDDGAAMDDLDREIAMAVGPVIVRGLHPTVKRLVAVEVDTIKTDFAALEVRLREEARESGRLVDGLNEEVGILRGRVREQQQHQLEERDEEILGLKTEKDELRTKSAGHHSVAADLVAAREEIETLNAQITAVGNIINPSTGTQRATTQPPTPSTQSEAIIKPYTPPVRILVPKALPQDGDFRVIVDYDRETTYSALPQAVKNAIAKQFETYLYNKRPGYGGPNWWTNVKDIERRAGSKTLCLWFLFSGSGYPAWTVHGAKKYACKTCTNMQRPCLMWDHELEEINVLPLVQDARASGPSTGPLEEGYWICDKPNFSLKKGESRLLWEEKAPPKRKAKDGREAESEVEGYDGKAVCRSGAKTARKA